MVTVNQRWVFGLSGLCIAIASGLILEDLQQESMLHTSIRVLLLICGVVIICFALRRGKPVGDGS